MDKRLEKRIASIYSQAEKELTEKVDSFFANFERLDKQKRADLASGKITEEEYKRWRKNKLLRGNDYIALRDNVADRMLDANRIAAAYVNGGMIPAYTKGFNRVGGEAEKALTGYSFTMINEDAVKRLVTNKQTILPYKVVDGKKDVRWNTKKINSAILQGIIQGESSKQMAKRLLESIPEMNKASAIRNARTAFTSAANHGRLDGMKRLQDDGVIVEKEWFASTGDGRTRDAHLELHHATAPIDEPFRNSIGEIMFPGDPEADPSNVYNCRCSIATVIKGFTKRMEPEPDDSHVVAEGQDITETWERRPDKFDFEIDDVINAQGFDGLPRVVSQEEFDKAVEESGLYAQRVYSAQTEEALEAYRKELYGGKFYVDCSVGGADFGQGMYMSGDFTGKKVKDVMEDSDRYVAISKRRGSMHSFIEKMTLDKDSKIATYDSLLKEYQTESVSIQNKITRDVGHKLVEEAVSKYGLNDDDRNFLLWGLNIPKEIEPFDVMKASKYSGDKKFIGSIRNDISSKIKAEKSANPIVSANADMGIYGTLKGYDAINIEGQAANGASQVLVLNRTKLIIRRAK